jgi:uncharacterized protein YbjT (DUF2867 family)
MKNTVFILAAAVLSIFSAATLGQRQEAATRHVYPEEVVLVAGATGRTGSHVVEQLRALGYAKVLAMTRNKENAIATHGSDIDWIEADVRDIDSLKAAFEGVDRVISAIGSTREDGNGTEAVEYLGVKNLTDAALDAGVKVLVITSSMGVTHEDHELNRFADNILLWKLKGEDYLRSSGQNYSIVRPGGLKPDIPGGQFGVYFDQGDDPRAGQISIADVASVLIEAANNPEAHGKTFETFNYLTRFPANWPGTFAMLRKD